MKGNFNGNFYKAPFLTKEPPTLTDKKEENLRKTRELRTKEEKTKFESSQNSEQSQESTIK